VSVESPTRLAVLLSGTGTNLQALLDAIASDPDFGGRVVAVGSDVADAGGLERARAVGIPTVVRQLADHSDRADWEAKLRADLEVYDADAVVLAGFMRILTGTFLSRWPGRVVNTHPSLLPAFRGSRAVRDALEWGVKVTGSTVHVVDEEVDHGPIIAQQAVEVRPDDTEETLHARIKGVEHELLPACVRLLCHDRLVIEGRHVSIRT
jgi:phosphoribosylglycinamide formyltransferase 1